MKHLLKAVLALLLIGALGAPMKSFASGNCLPTAKFLLGNTTWYTLKATVPEGFTLKQFAAAIYGDYDMQSSVLTIWMFDSSGNVIEVPLTYENRAYFNNLDVQEGEEIFLAMETNTLVAGGKPGRVGLKIIAEGLELFNESTGEMEVIPEDFVMYGELVDLVTSIGIGTGGGGQWPGISLAPDSPGGFHPINSKNQDEVAKVNVWAGESNEIYTKFRCILDSSFPVYEVSIYEYGVGEAIATASFDTNGVAILEVSELFSEQTIKTFSFRIDSSLAQPGDTFDMVIEAAVEDYEFPEGHRYVGSLVSNRLTYYSK